MRMETVLRAQAVRYPEKMALVCGDERITYRDLDQRIARVASGLKEKGLGAGDRVVLFLNNGVEIVELFYAAFALGAIVVPVTTRLTTHELLHICSDSQPSVIAFEGPGDSIKEVLEANPSALRIVVGKETDGSISHDSLRKSGVVSLPPLSVSSDDALIMYTSGTTGKPKGA